MENKYRKNVGLLTQISLAPFHLSTGNLKFTASNYWGGDVGSIE